MRDGVPIRSARLAWRVVTGEAVVVDPAASRVHVLNRTATALWGLMDGTRDPSGLVAEAAERMACDPPRLEADLEGLLGRLEAEGLIEWRSEAAGEGSYGAPAPPPVGEYVAPEISCTESLEVVAAVCASGRDGSGGCRVFGACQTPFE